MADGTSGSKERSTAELLRDGFRWFAEDIEMRAVKSGVELTPGATMTMGYLDEGPVRPSDLASRMRVSRQRVHVVLQELTAAGLAELVSHPGSGRDKLVHLTETGRTRRRQVAEAFAEVEVQAESRIGATNLSLLRSILQQLTAEPREPSQPVR